MLSNPRLVRGHLLIMPTRHIEAAWELKPGERDRLYDRVVFYQRKIITTGFSPGCDVRQNYRPFIPQGRLKVDHLHFHLLPRWPREQDELYQRCMKYEADIFAPLTDEEREELTQLYREPSAYSPGFME
jgi:diadenosine tetraphosphate (Ap4A) HIT family hydrolase